jgi:hypothetical protein
LTAVGAPVTAGPSPFLPVAAEEAAAAETAEAAATVGAAAAAGAAVGAAAAAGAAAADTMANATRMAVQNPPSSPKRSLGRASTSLIQSSL